MKSNNIQFLMTVLALEVSRLRGISYHSYKCNLFLSRFNFARYLWYPPLADRAWREVPPLVGLLIDILIKSARGWKNIQTISNDKQLQGDWFLMIYINMFLHSFSCLCSICTIFTRSNKSLREKKDTYFTHYIKFACFFLIRKYWKWAKMA